MALTFIEWLKKNNLLDETGTFTNSVAGFAQPLGAYMEIPRKKKKNVRHEGKEGVALDGGYSQSPALKDDDEFWGKPKPTKDGYDQQAGDYGLGGAVRQLYAGNNVKEKITGTNKLSKTTKDAPIKK